MELIAPPTWRRIDFISDLHLYPGAPHTVAAWRTYLAHTPADALFILGDLFEVWVGDDALDVPGSFEANCAAAMRAFSLRASLFIQCGNRDFLMGASLMAACGARALEEPTTLATDDLRLVLSHGDSLCTDDVGYQQFRKMVRSADWQSEFLARPLVQRQDIARGLREQSEQQKRGATEYADVDTQAAAQLLRDAQATHLIHGHTHRPAGHDLGNGLQRVVLSDWDMDAPPPRAQVLRLQRDAAGTWRFTRLSLEAAAS